MALRLSVPWRTDGQWVLDAVLHADMCLRHLWVTWLLLLRMEQVQWVLKLACIAAKHVCRHLVFADYYATGAGPAHHLKPAMVLQEIFECKLPGSADVQSTPAVRLQAIVADVVVRALPAMACCCCCCPCRRGVLEGRRQHSSGRTLQRD